MTTTHTTTRPRWLLPLIIFCFVIGIAPYTLQTLVPATVPALRTPAVALGVLLAALATTPALIYWARITPHPRGRAFIIAMLCVGAYTILTQSLATVAGWWAGTTFDLPPLTLALAGERGAFPFVAHLAVVLALYLLAATRWPRLGYALYGFFLLLLIFGTIYSDSMYLHSGAFIFRNGYTIAADLLYGLTLFALPILVYETLLRRRASKPPHPATP